MLGLGLSLTSLSLSPAFHSILRFIRSNQPGDYYQLDTPVTFATGQEFTIELITDLSPTGGYLLADTQQTFRLAYDTSGAIIISITENGTLSDRIHPGVLQPYQDGALHKVEFMRRNGFLVLAINGTSIVAEYSETEITFDTIFKGWAIQRYFTRIDNNTKGFDLPAPINFEAGPVAVRVRMAFFGTIVGRVYPTYGSTRIVLDGYSDNVDFIYRSQRSSVPVDPVESDYGDGTIVEYLLKYDGSLISGFINGVTATELPLTSDGSSQITDIFPIGHSLNSIFYPVSVEVWADTDDTSSQPTHHYTFDADGTSSIEIDVAGGNNLNKSGLSTSDTELFTYDEALSAWKNADDSVILKEIS